MHTNETWYRNPWVWLVIAIPALTVLGCTFTLYLALTHPVSLVNDAAQDTPVATGSRTNGGD